MPSRHEKLSPSDSKRWMKCHGAIAFCEANNFTRPTSRYADIGTLAHEIGEEGLRNNTDFEVAKLPFVKHPLFDEVKPEAVQSYIDYVFDLIEHYEDLGFTTELLVEQWADLSWLKIPGMGGGTADAVILYYKDGVLWGVEVIDYKNGVGEVVDPEMNTQALCYGVGVVHNAVTDENITLCPSAEFQVMLTIVQPNAFHEDGPIRSFTISGQDLGEWSHNELYPAGLANQEPNAPLIASDEACRWCPASGRCPAQLEKLQEVAMIDFEDVPAIPDAKTLTYDQIEKLIIHAPFIKKLLESAEVAALEMMERGMMHFKGIKLVRKQSRRKLLDIETVIRVLDDANEQLSKDGDEYIGCTEPKMRTLTAIEKDLKSHFPKKYVADTMNKITTKPEGALTVAPTSDKRKAVNLLSDFDDVEVVNK